MKGIELRKKIKLCGISLREVANLLEISEQNLQNKLNADDVKVSFLQELAKKLDKDITFFLYDQIYTQKINKNINSVAEKLSVANYKGIPYLLQSVIAGFGNADFSIGEQDVKDYYVIPMFKSLHIDFMIDVRGSSMQPKYNSGDIIACTIMHERSFIQWNKCHVIATREQGIIVKRLRKSDKQGYLTAVSDNKDYPPFEIPESGITGIALVVGVVRLE